MDERERTRTSRFLSLVLRHQPELIGIELDSAGWVAVELLLTRCGDHGRVITRASLEEIVATSPKRRFAFSDDGRRIRASQGHSVAVELGYAPSRPPEQLYHGTVASALPLIREGGLARMQRHHVHLSPERVTASDVGQRRGKPILLEIRAAEMAEAGYLFFLSANGVWLTEQVPPRFIDFPG